MSKIKNKKETTKKNVIDVDRLRSIQYNKSKKYTHQAIADYVGLERSTITKFLNGTLSLPDSIAKSINHYLSN